MTYAHFINYIANYNILKLIFQFTGVGNETVTKFLLR